MAKNKIVISIKGTENSYGPIIIAMVVVDSNFFRKVHLIDSLKDPALKGKMINDNAQYMNVLMIEAKDVKSSKITKSIIDILNTYPKFWEHSIYINGRYDEFLDAFMPENLRKQVKSVTNIISKDKCKEMMLADTIAELALKEETDYHNLLYGSEIPEHLKRN